MAQLQVNDLVLKSQPILSSPLPSDLTDSMLQKTSRSFSRSFRSLTPDRVVREPVRRAELRLVHHNDCAEELSYEFRDGACVKPVRYHHRGPF